MVGLNNRSYSLLLFSIFLIGAGFSLPLQARPGPLNLEPVDLIPKNQSEFTGGVTFEKERSLATVNPQNATTTTSDTNLNYDNTRLKAVDLRMGLLDNFELNLGFNYSMNSSASDHMFTPDESGIEGIVLGGKIGWHPNIATSLRIKFNGESSVHPHGSDDPVFMVNFPLKVPFAGGMLNGELGANFQSGEVTTGNNTQIGNWKEQFTGGIGYSYKANHIFDFTMEVSGQTAPAEDISAGPDLDFNNLLNLGFGSTVHMAPGVRMRPSLGFALLDGSPDFSIGLQYEIDLGKERRSSEYEKPSERRYSRKEPVGMPEIKQRNSRQQPRRNRQREQRNTSPNIPSPQTERRQQNQAGGMRGIPEVPTNEAEKLMKEGYQAAQEGNMKLAIQKYDQAAELDPENLIIESNLGSLHYRQGNFDQALRHYKKAVQLNPNDEFSMLYLGATNYHVGNTDKARQYFRRVKNLNPQNKRVQEWLKQLEEQE